MNEAIKLAIEKGGYKYGHGIDGDYETNGWSYQEIIDDGIQYKLVLDPLFWQSLGRALGENWNDYVVISEHGVIGRAHVNQARWLYNAHQYFDLLLTGGDTEKFWQDLLKGNQ